MASTEYELFELLKESLHSPVLYFENSYYGDGKYCLFGRQQQLASHPLETAILGGSDKKGSFLFPLSIKTAPFLPANVARTSYTVKKFKRFSRPQPGCH
jgi:hypothetical protein